MKEEKKQPTVKEMVIKLEAVMGDCVKDGAHASDVWKAAAIINDMAKRGYFGRV
jgi:hypothetical protein